MTAPPRTPLHRRRASGFVAAVTVLLAALAAVFASTAPAGAVTPWQETNHNGSTPDSPAMAFYAGSNVEVIRGQDNNLWFNVDNGDFNHIGGVTYAAPSITVFRGELWIWHTGQNGDVWGQNLANPGESNHRRWYWNRPIQFSTQNIGGSGSAGSPTLSPAVAASPDLLHFVVVGANERIYHATMGVNRNFSRWTELPGGARTESGAGASTSPDNRLTVVHRGTDNRIYRQGLNFLYWQWDNNWQQVRNTYTNAAPSVAYNHHDDRMVLVWRQASSGQVLAAEISTTSADASIPQGVPNGNNVASPSAPRVDSEPDGVGLTIRGGNFYDVRGNYYRNNIIYNIHNYYFN
ncbi:hypothetical protein ACFC1T_32800 [Kitasatospora sp. NPDC056076]|uniref:hypothetical protein n=1 Tax=Kitasatospora sp. NPDC056076 TaxID=3345703 RepID=UPI0035DC5BE8